MVKVLDKNVKKTTVIERLENTHISTVIGATGGKSNEEVFISRFSTALAYIVCLIIIPFVSY